MKRSFPIVIALLIVLLMGGTLWFLYSKSRPREAKAETEKPFRTEILKKSVASGTISPRREVELKPKVAGILRNLFVKPGDEVKKGDVVGEVEIIVDPVGLNEAELRFKSAVLREERAKRDLDRVVPLAAQGNLAAAELDRFQAEHELAVEEMNTARSRVQLLRAGALKQTRGAPTLIESTVDGTVLSIPVKVGSSVINANSFNPGTTVAFVADMSDMIFKGTVDESEVGKLKAGMPVQIVIGALNDSTFEGTLQFVAPKSVVKLTAGTTEFEIEAAFSAPKGVTVRAGYSANANIVLERRTNVLAVSESFLVFEKGKPHVEVVKGEGPPERRPIEVGLSDGLKIEVLGGVTEADTLRKPQPAP